MFGGNRTTATCESSCSNSSYQIRCIVSNAYGSATSNAVTMAIIFAELNVTPSSRVLPSNAALSSVFTITSNTNWTAVCDQSWCEIYSTPGSTSGTGNGSVGFIIYSINPGTTARTATITITTTTGSPCGKIIKTVTVVQPGN